MKAKFLLLSICYFLIARAASAQSNRRLVSQDIPPPLGNIPFVGDSIFFNGHDSAFWLRNKYFDASMVTKDTSFVFARSHRNDCVLYFKLLLTDTLKVITVTSYKSGNTPDLVPIDSMYVAYQLKTKGMLRT